MPVVVLAGLIVVGRRRGSAVASLEHVERPGPLNREQKTTLTLTLIMMATVLLPPIASLLLPDNAAVAFVNAKVDIGLIASVFSVIALLLKLGDERQAIASLPWGTIIMICGVGMLISVAIKAGTIDLLGSWIGTNIPPALIPVAFGVAAALMSLFASTLGVVTPALFPLVLPIANTLAIDPMIIFIAIVVGAQATSISPFSSGGSLILGSCPDDRARAGLLPKLCSVPHRWASSRRWCSTCC
ncbi:SLC13 family permease [Salinicola tamaricis]|uniref:SLC13 family permease n=1 Tax=Salinicola tamaricis TaxID=1771309 RepID=UPI001F5C5BF2|nr:SLC13 family permease [Salinicola tamaricis]